MTDMQRDRRFFNRVGYVEVEDSHGTVSRFGGSDTNTYDMRFEVNKICGAYSNFSVSILGLSSETINRLTVYNPADSYSHPRLVRVYAGYKEMYGAQMIASGYIMTSSPTNPPNRWLTMNCCKYFAMKHVPEQSMTVQNKTVKEVFELCAKNMGLIPVINAKRVDWDKKVSSFSISGTVDMLCEKFSNTFGCVATVEDVSLVCLDRSNFYDVPSDCKELNIYTGFIDTVNIDVGGAKFRTRLNTRYQSGDWVRFTSEVNPKYDVPP